MTNNNYPFDSKNVPPASQGDSSGSMPGFSPSTPGIDHSAPNTGGSSGNNRLPGGVVLSSGRYTIEGLVAAGGMGAVYRAIDTRFNRPCAVKEMLDNFSNEAERAQSVEWFSREATLLLDLNHPCIPRVRDFFAEGGKHYLVMDFIEGQTLGKMMEREGNVVGVNGARGVSEARARSWMRQVASVLAYLHSQDPPVIFRDLKPSNVMVTDRDEVKLIDFGIARTFQSQRQATVIMTLGYAPPEQLHGMPEPRSDLYALGATLHRVLTGHDAVNNKPNIFAFPPVRTLRPDLSAAFEQVLMKALAPNLEQRWATAEELERALINLPPITVAPPVGKPGASTGPGPSTYTIPHSGPQSGHPVSHTTSGPAGSFINAALGHLSANPPRVEDANNAIRAAYSLEPNNSVIHKIFGRIFAHRQPPDVDNAIRAYSQSARLFPDDPEIHKLLGDVWLYLRPNYAQAIQAYTQSLRLRPDDFEAHERLAICYEKTGQLEPALREFQEAERLATAASRPPQVLLHLHYVIGNTAFRANQLPLAEKHLVQVLFQNPADHQTRFLLAQVYEREGKLQEALRECTYVVGPLGPTDPMVHQVYHRLRQRLGQ
jgi:serine/threonine protein kinase